MKRNAARVNEPGGRTPKAFTLIEMIGALTLLALVAAVAVPATIRQLDRVASEQELARLQTLGDTLEKSILRTHSISANTNWAAGVATEAGMDIGAVTNNLRNHLRVLWVDASGWLSTNLPYTNGYQGTPALPANARMMLVSSLGKNLPIASGMPAASDFAALWDVSPGTVPSSGAWAGWTGAPEDVKIHRINLSPLFVKLVLTTYMSATNGQYTIDSSPINSVPYTNGFAAYFLKGTGLRLYCGSPDSTLNSSQILNEDSSFVYEGGMWKNFLQGRVISSLGNVGGIVAAFLSATPNINAQYALTNYQQILVARTFTQYMSNYNVWAEGNFANNTLKTLLKSVQVNMMDAVHGLYQAGGGPNDCYPTNGVP